jgi:hypothetical protein
MGLLLSCSAVLLAVVVVACNTVDPNDCYINSSGGFGGVPVGNSSCNPCVGDTIGCADAMDAGADVMDACAGAS